jgi:hypothetical protein
MAKGCNYSKRKSAAMSGADSPVYDKDAHGCVPVAS